MKIKEIVKIPEDKRERRIFFAKVAAIALLVIFVIFTWRCVVPSKKYEGADFIVYGTRGSSSNGEVAYTTYVPFGRIRVVSTEGNVYIGHKEIGENGNAFARPYILIYNIE